MAMSPEDRLKQLVGELHFQVVLLSSKLEEAQTKIIELEAQVKANTPTVN